MIALWPRIASARGAMILVAMILSPIGLRRRALVAGLPGESLGSPLLTAGTGLIGHSVHGGSVVSPRGSLLRSRAVAGSGAGSPPGMR